MYTYIHMYIYLYIHEHICTYMHISLPVISSNVSACCLARATAAVDPCDACHQNSTNSIIST